MKISISVICSLLVMYSCTKDVTDSKSLDQQLTQQIQSISDNGTKEYYILPTGYADIPQDRRNSLTEPKVELGKLLFFETGFANNALYTEGLGTYSCSTCHIPEAGFRANQPQGIADGGEGYGLNGDRRLRNTNYKENELDVQSARPLSMVNVAFVTNTFWNGQFGPGGANLETEDVWSLRTDTERNYLGYDGIETVNFEGVFTHRILVNEESIVNLGYRNYFDDAFEDIETKDRYSNFTASLALSAYIRSIIANEAPFQYWLKGDNEALSESMKKGALLFFGKAKCANCHYKQNLGSSEFHALGVKDMYQRPSFNTNAQDRRNLGRGGFTLKSEDNYKFKVPGLYNVGDSPFYFHGASKNTLHEVIEYKARGLSENNNVPQNLVSTKLVPIDLTSDEVDNLVEFIKYGLRDPNLKRYKPEKILSGNCFPNADFQSIIDIGCN